MLNSANENDFPVSNAVLTSYQEDLELVRGVDDASDEELELGDDEKTDFSAGDMAAVRFNAVALTQTQLV